MAQASGGSKPKAYKLHHKLTLVFCVLSITLTGIITFSLNQAAQRQVMEDIKRRLFDIVSIAPAAVDTETHATLTEPQQEGSASYLKIRKVLQQIRDSSTDIHFIYTMRPGEDGKILFVVDAETNPANIAHLGEEYDDASDLLRSRFADLKKPVVEQAFYTDEWGTWLSGYAPLYLPDGHRIGVLGVDISASTVLAYKKRLLFISIGVFLLTLPLIIFVGYFFGLGMAKPIMALTKSAERIGDGDLEQRIEVTRRDEIGTLASSFNNMAMKLKDSRAALNEMMENYRDIFDNAIEGIFRSTVHGQFTTVNRALIRMLRYDSFEDLTATVTDISSQIYKLPEDRARVMELLNEKGRVNNLEVEFKRKDGNIFWVELNAHFVEGKDNGDQLIEGMVMDITERRQREKAEEKRRVAEAASQAKSDFLANMSHEIRTPLNAVMGLTDLTLRTDLSPKQNEYLYKIKASSQTLLAVVNDILDLSKIEAGRMDLEQTNFNLYDVMANLSEMFGHQAQKKEIELMISIDEGVPCALVGDPVRLGQILINLTGNALKFTDKGEILVSVHPGGLILDQNSDHAVIKFSVKDTGQGIPHDRLEQIFESFTQADSSITRKHGGTGLGLSISRQLVQLMGGDIQVESEVGRGSIFHFTGVFKRQPPEKQIKQVAPTDLRGLKVLIVDDNQTSREILTNFIESFHMVAKTAASGLEAIDLIREAENAFDLILMDWKMPKLNGLETAKRIKHDLDLDKLPIVCMISAYARQDLMQESEKTLLEAFLHKPINQSLLFDTIMNLFGHKSQTGISDRPDQESSLEQFKSQLSSGKILLVEDNIINQEIAVEWLGSVGLHVQTVGNGKEALARLSEEEFDAVLMDVQMPVMDGFETTTRIRQNPSWEDLPIIAMTAHALTGDREKCLDAGMNDYVAKPIDPQDLFSALARCIAGRTGNGTGPGPVVPLTTEEAAPEIKARVDGFPDLRLPGIDVETGLYRANGNIPLFLRLLKSFDRDFTGADRQILEDLENGQKEKAHRLAHSLKGVSGNIGANRLGELAADVESAIEDDRFDNDSTTWADFVYNLNEVLNGLKNAGPVWDDPKPEDRRPVYNREELLNNLNLLSELLDEDLGKARDLATEMGTGLESLAMGDLFYRLMDQIDDFDLDQASETLEELMVGLKEKKG